MKIQKKVQPKKALLPKAVLSPSSARLMMTVDGVNVPSILGAAYLMTDKAYCLLGGDKVKKITVTLTPKPDAGLTPKQLSARFLSEYSTQLVRWAISRNNQPIREHIIERAIMLANGHEEVQPEPPAAAEALNDEQRKEIERLIAEVEEEIKTMNEKKTVSDPKGLRSSWEEKQESK